MMRDQALAMLAFLLIAAAGAGCDDDARSESATRTEAVDFDGHECAACGMIVREQPSPRGQAVHADGARVYFCALSDMLTYLKAPSPHGDIMAVYVEAGDPALEDPLANDTGRRPWVTADEASFVLGIERERIMGEPVLSYRSESDARGVARRTSGRVVDWQTLRR